MTGGGGQDKVSILEMEVRIFAIIGDVILDVPLDRDLIDLHVKIQPI